MPKLKQPTALEEAALGVLLEYVVNYCHQLSINGSLDELRQGVSVVKEQVWNYVPWYLLADFSSSFIDELFAKERRVFHRRAILEILIDIEIVGLRCTGPIPTYLDAENLHRIRTLQELDLSHLPADIWVGDLFTAINLDNFHFDDLTTFVYPNNCVDGHLTAIGPNCPKLQVLKVRASKVTDEGLRILSPCSELRVVDIVDCPVSHSGINRLLSMHKKIEEFAHWDGTGKPEGCKILSHLDSSVCPSINRFVFENDREQTLLDLEAVVAKFPNLTFLKINCRITEDLVLLKSLDKLVGIEIEFCYDMYYDEVEETWGSMKTLLTFIGANITTLKLSCWDQGFLWHQSEVDFIFNSCPNIEYLGFDQGGGLVVIPPFARLKELVPRIPINFDQIEILDDPALEFSNLLKLETLSVLNYGFDLQTIESIMLNDVKFPNLSMIEVNCMKPEDLEQLERTARNKNLDFKIKNDPESNWYIEYRFGDNRDDDDDADDAE